MHEGIVPVQNETFNIVTAESYRFKSPVVDTCAETIELRTLTFIDRKQTLSPGDELVPLTSLFIHLDEHLCKIGMLWMRERGLCYLVALIGDHSVKN